MFCLFTCLYSCITIWTHGRYERRYFLINSWEEQEKRSWKSGHTYDVYLVLITNIVHILNKKTISHLQLSMKYLEITRSCCLITLKTKLDVFHLFLISCSLSVNTIEREDKTKLVRTLLYKVAVFHDKSEYRPPRVHCPLWPYETMVLNKDDGIMMYTFIFISLGPTICSQN